MGGQDNNDRIADLLKQAYPPAVASPEFKTKLRQHLNQQVGAIGTGSPKPLWQQPFLWIPAAAVSAVAVAIVIYFVAFQSAPLTVTTIGAIGVQATAASISANVDGLGAEDSANVSFEWGTTTDYGNETTPEVRSENGRITANLSDLAPNTTYHFRVKAVGRHGTVYGSDMEFTTAALPAWDINQDGKVDYGDRAILEAHYGETTSLPYPAWDINQDGKVDHKDLAILGAHYGETY